MIHEVITGDCLEEMPALLRRGHLFDACIVDPPYGTTSCAWDTVIPFEPMWSNLDALVREDRAVVSFAAQPFSSALVMSKIERFRYEWIWQKDIATGHLNAHERPMLEHESILVFDRAGHLYNPQGLQPFGKVQTRGGQSDNYGTYGLSNYQEFTNYPRSVLEFPVHRRSKRHDKHPTQKPVELMRYLVRTYTNEGDLVLDFACGYGSTGVACVIEKRAFIGIEIDEYYARVARARIKRAKGVPCDIPRQVKREVDLPLFR